MKRIICGTDFSIHAAEAANVAAALAAQHNATLTLTHVVDSNDALLLDRKTLDVIRNNKRRKLMSEESRLRAAGARVLENIVSGTPHEALVKEARRIGASLIVVGSVGEVSAQRWLAGSVALRTAQKATVPTLVVRDYLRLLAWARGERPLNVFVCYDFSPTSDAALSWVASLQSWGTSRVSVTYVSWPPEESWRLGAARRGIDEDSSSEAQSLLERGIRRKCERILGNVETKIHVVSTWGRADVHLNELANAADADLVVVGANHRNRVDRFWMGSVSRGVIRHSRGNVACVPGSYVPASAEPNTSESQRRVVPVDFMETNEELDLCGPG